MSKNGCICENPEWLKGRAIGQTHCQSCNGYLERIADDNEYHCERCKKINDKPEGYAVYVHDRKAFVCWSCLDYWHRIIEDEFDKWIDITTMKSIVVDNLPNPVTRHIILKSQNNE